MSSQVEFVWILKTTGTPLIKRPCGRCGAAQSFISTGKFRLNANGSRLDAWLIYACITCGKRWNRTVFERKPISDLAQDQLIALQENDKALARQIAINTGNGEAVQEVEFSILSQLRSSASGDGSGVAIVINNPDQCNIRLDRILSRGLALSRSKIYDLARCGDLVLCKSSPKMLRRPVCGELKLFLPREYLEHLMGMSKGRREIVT